MANFQARGENNPRAVLTVAKVREIREVWALFGDRRQPLPGKHNNHVVSVQKLAEEYGVGYGTMQSLLSRKTWRYV